MKIPAYLKNKFIITAILFLLYMFFLDDMDAFKIVSNLRKRNALVEQNMIMKQKVVESRSTLRKLRQVQYLEHFARSKKYFKQIDEDIFVIIPKNSKRN